ncbi:hypothetical protein KJK34_04695 [Flavobacterium sp. D11R37]|uniref:hypothetical protein n=1 Tax=Flavobacterium coralii TaxID=2838017 RepID=UPI001CA73D44|nr:hypothetical protein [Flavobacterium coralii]MBY8962045.1 hypothetical protein [Flavobacterium coralii]
MATKQKRSICKLCGVKTVQSKMLLHSDSWYHAKCHSELVLSSGGGECLTELVDKLKKCPYHKLVAEKFSTPFWIEIREKYPITFEHKIFVEYGLVPSV